MKRIFEKVKGKLVRIDKNTVGVVCGFTTNRFLLLLEEGVDAVYAFSLDELGSETHYIDVSYESECENSLYANIDKKDIFKKHAK